MCQDVSITDTPNSYKCTDEDQDRRYRDDALAVAPIQRRRLAWLKHSSCLASSILLIDNCSEQLVKHRMSDGCLNGPFIYRVKLVQEGFHYALSPLVSLVNTSALEGSDPCLALPCLLLASALAARIA
jgi:hypothetical protein